MVRRVVRVSPVSKGVLDAISEREFEKQIKETAKRFGWLYYHTHRSQFSPAGFPDCVLVRGSEKPIWAELKAMKGKLGLEQREWLLALARAGQRVYLWRPDSLQQVMEILR